MAEALQALREHEGRPLFIEGYFSKRIWKGDLPKYGYPKNHVPEVGDVTMEVVTGFLAAFDAGQK